MDDYLGLFCGGLCVLAVVAVVGHGIWAGVASVFHWISREEASPLPIASRTPCPKCGARYGVLNRHCQVCGATTGQLAQSDVRTDLLATARQLKRMLDRGDLTAEDHQRLAAVIERDLDAVRTGIAQPASVAARLPKLQAAPLSERINPAFPHATPYPPLPEPALVPTAASSKSIDEPILAESVEEHLPAAAPALQRSTPLAVAPAEPSPPAPKLADMLQSFLEDSNIRIGEIAAGFFIVVSAIGLVVSLRATLERIPYFPALLFTSFTAAFHGAGLYTLKRWNLHAVSRVVLIISLLLVPLTASAAVLLSAGGRAETAAATQGNPLLFGLVLTIATAALSWVVYTSSRELVGAARWPLTIAIVGCSLSQVLFQRLRVIDTSFWSLTVLAAAPIASYLFAVIAQLIRGRTWSRISTTRALQTFLILGTSAFALVVALALLIFRASPHWLAAGRLSVAMSLAAAASLATGLLVYRRATARTLGGVQTAGAAIALVSGFVMLLLAVLAWPQPALLLAIGLLNGALLITLAIAGRLPLLHIAGVACVAMAAVIGLHLAQGRFVDVPLPQLGRVILEAALMGRSSVALLLVCLAAVGAAISVRRHRSDDAQALLMSAGGIAVIGAAVALFAGFVSIPDWQQDRDFAAPLLLIYAFALLAAAPAASGPWLAAAGSAFLFAAVLQALRFNATAAAMLSNVGALPARPWSASLVLHAIVTGAIALAATGRRLFNAKASRSESVDMPMRPSLIDPLAVCAAASLMIAAVVLPFGKVVELRETAFEMLLAAVAWGTLAYAMRWQGAFSALQVMLASAIGFATATLFADANQPRWPIGADHLSAQLLALALGAAAWPIVRRLTHRHATVRQLLAAPWPAVDQLLLGGATAGLAGLALAAATPSVAWELGYSEFDPYFVGALSTLAVNGPKLAWTGCAVLVALVIALWERVRLPALIGLGVVSFAFIFIGAATFENTNAAATAARFLAAALTVGWGAIYIARTPLILAARSQTWLRFARTDRTAANLWFQMQPLLLGGLPVLLITFVAVAQNASGVNLRGPNSDTFFARIGATASYAGPLLTLVAVLVGYALRQRRAVYMFAASAVFQLAVNLAFVLHVSGSTLAGEICGAEWLQWNAVALGIGATVWVALRSRIRRGCEAESSKADFEGDELLTLQIGLTTFATAALVIWAASAVIWWPDWSGPSAIANIFGHPLSFLAVGLTCLSLGGFYRATLRDWAGDLTVALLTAIVSLAAAWLDQYDPSRQWLAYHALTLGWLAIGAATAVAVAVFRRAASLRRLAWRAPHPVVAAIMAALLVTLAVRSNQYDPGEPWWSFAAATGAVLICTAIGLARRSQPFAYAASFGVGLAFVLFWIAPTPSTWRSSAAEQLLFIEGFTIAMLAAAGFWLAVEVRSQRRDGHSFDLQFRGPRIHSLIAIGLLGPYLFLRVLQALFDDRVGFTSYEAGACATLVAWTLLLFGGLWDRRALLLQPLLFVWMTLVWLLALSLLHGRLLRFEDRVAFAVLAVAVQVAVAGHLWSFGANLAAIGMRWGVHEPVEGLRRIERWLPAVSVLLAVGACAGSFLLVLVLPNPTMRTAVAFAPAAAAWGLACLAGDDRRRSFRLVALLMAGLAGIHLAWAQVGIDQDAATWLTRIFRLMMVLAVLVFIYGLALPRFLFNSENWLRATRRAGFLTSVAAVATFIGLLGLEVALFVPGVGAPVAGPQVGAIAVVLAILIAGMMSLALMPERDPLAMSEKGRQLYVYAAIAVGALLFAHLYVCRPVWFDHGLRPYWPLIVMAIAFLGAGAGEVFTRFKLPVLAEPFTRVGSLLPLLPVLGMWVMGARTDYALVLFVVGLLYLMLSVTKRSWAALLAATVAGNGALWTLLRHNGFIFLAHPQFWLIPPALSLLAAAQVNRKRLSPATLASIRYGCTTLIYVSSTSEIFLRGVASSIWPPMILAALSLAGAALGMALRIRAFLFLGCAFALLSLFTMVAHAAQAIEHVWPWWAFGVGTGIAILVLFGLFEKNREAVLGWIARLREWEK